jgi:hypothetical protein
VLESSQNSAGDARNGDSPFRAIKPQKRGNNDMIHIQSRRLMASTFLLCVFIALSLCLLVVQFPAQAVEAMLEPKVDERIELLGVIFHLAGNPEYNEVKIKSYESDIDRYFAPYKEDPAVLMARKLYQECGVEYNAVTDMAVLLAPPPALTPLVPFSDTMPEQRCGRQHAPEFAREVRQFYFRTRFHNFFVAHKALYTTSESRLQNVLRKVDPSWHEKLFGKARAGNFKLVLSVVNGGSNYAAHVNYPDGRRDTYAIIGCWKPDNEGRPTFAAEDLATIQFCLSLWFTRT